MGSGVFSVRHMSITGIGVVCVALACAVHNPGHPEPPEPTGTDCDAADERLRELQCRGERGRPLWETPDGVPFADACRYALSDGRDWSPTCLATIDSCDEVESCR